ITYLKQSLTEEREDVETQKIIFGSEYDKIEMLEITSEADYTQANENFPVPLKDNPTIEIEYKDEDGETFYFSGEFTVEDGDLMIGAYGFIEESILSELAYDIQTGDNAEDDNNGENDDINEGEETASAGEEAYQMNCAACHGDDLQGAVGPDLTTAGDNFTEEELMDIMENGKGDMPPMLTDEEKSKAIAEWLLD